MLHFLYVPVGVLVPPVTPSHSSTVALSHLVNALFPIEACLGINILGIDEQFSNALFSIDIMNCGLTVYDVNDVQFLNVLVEIVLISQGTSHDTKSGQSSNILTFVLWFSIPACVNPYSASPASWKVK